MPKRVSKSKRSRSISSDHLSDVSVGNESSSLKRTVSVSSDGSEREISQASPTKKYKTALPDSPEYDAQRPVTVTGKSTTKSISRKLNFNTFDDEASVPDPGHADSGESALGEEKHLRKPSKKAMYMESAVGHRQRDSPEKVGVVVAPPLPSRKSDKKAVPTVKLEYVSDDDLPIKISTRGNAQSALIEISSDDDDNAALAGSDDDTPKPARKAETPKKLSGRVRRSDDETPQPPRKAEKSPKKSGRDQVSSVSATTKVDAVLLPISIFTLHPSDSMKGPAYAPKDLRDPDTDKPIFLQPHGFDTIFEPPTLTSLNAATEFEICTPFVNPAKVSPEKLLIGDYKHLIWPGSKQNAIFTILGAVSSCDIIHSTSIGSHRYRAVTIIPHEPSFGGFMAFLENKYGCSHMFGPFEFGCLLTFSSRREGLSSAYGSSSHVHNTKRNMKAFGSSANTPPAALWFEKQFPPFMDFDQDIPIYDAHSRSFMFTKEDFVGLPSFPRFKKPGDPKLADLPPNALVTVFFTMNTYLSTRAPPTPSSIKTPVASSSSRNNLISTPAKGSSTRADDAFTSNSSSTQVLSPNLQFLLYHGMIPDDD